MALPIRLRRTEGRKDRDFATDFTEQGRRVQSGRDKEDAGGARKAARRRADRSLPAAQRRT